MSRRKSEEETDLKLCVCVCTCTERQMCVCHSVPTAECSTLSLFSHPTRSGLSVTHCFTQFTICTCPPSHLFVSHAVLHCLCFLSFLVASSVSFLFFQIWFLFSALSPLSVLDSHSSSVSSHLPENFTIALNDAWVSFDSLSSLHRNIDSSAFPEMIVQEYRVCLCVSICIGNGVRNHNRWF